MLGILLGIAFVAAYVILVYMLFKIYIIDTITDIYNGIKKLIRRIRIARNNRNRKK